MARTTLIFFMLAEQAMTATAARLAKVVNPLEISTAWRGPLVGGPLVGGPGAVPHAGPAGVITNEADLRAVQNAQLDAQLQEGLYGGLLNNRGSDEGRIWTGGADSQRFGRDGAGRFWPGNDRLGVPIQLGDKVRNLVNNDVGMIVALESASGQHSLKFLSDRHGPLEGGIFWLQPDVISHDVVGYTYIPPHQGPYKEGDKVVVVDPANKWAFGETGRVGNIRSGHGDTGKMRVDFGPLGPLDEFAWFEPSQLRFAD